jgi:enoyl-CoA hydratase/carnithine racemase
MEPFLLLERDGSIVTLRMNRPERRNALTDTGEMLEFCGACADISRDPSIKAVILTGVGSAFCAGGNLKDMQQKTGIAAGSPYEMRNRYRSGVQRIPLSLYELEIPVIAAINGAAMGLGLDLACMCE